MMRTAVCLCLLLLPALAAADEVEDGRALALRWCTGCHVVVSDRPGGDAGPPFESLRANRTEPALRAWLFKPHPPMPDLQLTAAEIDAIMAFIRSLDD